MLHTTAYRFPGILRWFEVVETEVVGLYNSVTFLFILPLAFVESSDAKKMHVARHFDSCT